MSLDARVRYTKMMISKSFIQLLNEKPLYKIKLKEICELAGINRSTYYRYYKDTYDWAEQFEQECLKWANIYMERIDHNGIYPTVIDMLNAIKQNSDLFTALFSSQNNYSVPNKALELYIQKLRNSLYPNNSSTEAQWNSSFVVYGLNGLIQTWINDGMQTPIEEIANFMVQKINSLIKQNYQ